MPIEVPFAIKQLTRAEFLERDEIVMRCAYASQNGLGRLCEEQVYERDLALRLRAEGMQNVMTQVPIRVSHGRFAKEYRLDLVADDAVYELKTVLQLLGEHDTQVFNYAALLGIPCIKLLNFRPGKVDGKLRLSPVTEEKRLGCSLTNTGWLPLTSQCETLSLVLAGLVADLGGFLAASLYEEAITCLTPAVWTRLNVNRDGIELGMHPMQMIAEDIGCHVTTFTDTLVYQRSHLDRLFQMLPLKAVHWINFDHQNITLTTLIKS